MLLLVQGYRQMPEVLQAEEQQHTQKAATSAVTYALTRRFSLAYASC